jgi:mRNA-degrading endonuclease RelE of RelBE toxin-antitoxin system
MLTFIETQLFSRLVREYLSDDEYADVQAQLVRNPEAGSVVRGSGGVRKLRVAAQGRGKSGGYRLIYYLGSPKGVVWMLTIYPKSERDSIPAHVLRQIKEEIERGQ